MKWEFTFLGEKGENMFIYIALKYEPAKKMEEHLKIEL